jgi:ribosomal protein S8
LPPITLDEELLLNININELYKKKEIENNVTNAEVSDLDISNKIIHDKFKNKCNNCLKYRRFIMDLCKVFFNTNDIIIEKHMELSRNNENKLREIHDILKKPKVKPFQINKLYNDFTNGLGIDIDFTSFVDGDLINICSCLHSI